MDFENLEVDGGLDFNLDLNDIGDLGNIFDVAEDVKEVNLYFIIFN